MTGRIGPVLIIHLLVYNFLFFYDPISYRVVGRVTRVINGALGDKFNAVNHFSVD